MPFYGETFPLALYKKTCYLAMVCPTLKYMLIVWYLGISTPTVAYIHN